MLVKGFGNCSVQLENKMLCWTLCGYCGDDTWMYRYIVKTKKQSSQWKSESSQDCQKHDRADLMWRQCWLFSSTVEIWCCMCLFLDVKQWIKNCIWPLDGVCKKQCEWNDRNSSRNTVGCLPTITLLHIHHSAQKFLTKLMSSDSASTIEPRSPPPSFSCPWNWNLGFKKG